jgi:hypothetical protein
VTPDEINKLGDELWDMAKKQTDRDVSDILKYACGDLHALASERRGGPQRHVRR